MSTPPATLPLAKDRLAFLCCREIEAVVVPISSRQEVRSVRILFLGSAESETWNSWLRAPRLPPRGALSLYVKDALISTEEHRFMAAAAADTPLGSATLIELRFSPREIDGAILRFPPGRWALAQISVENAHYVGPAWPGGPELFGPALRPQLELPPHGDTLADALRAIAAARHAFADEPTLEDVYRLALPYRGGALLGIPEGPLAYQLWDGGIVLRPPAAPKQLGDRVLLQLRLDDAPLWVAAPRQNLHKGYLPIGEVELARGEVTVRETARIDEMGVLRLSLELRNQSAQQSHLEFFAVAAQRITAENDAKQHAELHTTLGCHIENDALKLTAEPAPPPRFTVEPGQSVALELSLPLYAPSAVSFADDETFLASGTQLHLPDPFLSNLWRALLLHTRLFIRDGIMRYGLFPGLYENGLFGVEEGWNIVSLAQLGHGALAQSTLQRTFFDAEFLKKEGPHHQYRNGLAITYALDVYTLTGDRAALTALWPTVLDSAMWIANAFASTRSDENGTRPAHYGLLPKHIYGGDLRTPAYSLYASSACWRGLRDAGRVARILDETAAAERFFAAAAEVRKDIYITAERIYRHDATPPFLPFRTDETASAPSSGDYYQLFASLILETALFGWHGRFATALTDYLEQTGRQVLGVPRFDGWFQRLGIDAEYARGSQLAALHRRDFARFQLGVLGQLGLSCDPHTFVSPETAVVRFTAAEQAERLRTLATQAVRCDSDPCSAGTGVMLQYLRLMLCTETRDDDDLPTGTLWLGAAVPAQFFAPNKSFAVTNLPTSFGKISYRCTTEPRWVVYDITSQNPCEVEPFYRDSDGKLASTTVRIEGEKRLTIPRH